MTDSAAFRPHERIRRREEFQRGYAEGSKVHGRFGILFLLPNGLDVSRLGIAATMKFGGSVMVAFSFYLYGDQASAAVARDEPAWQAWIGEHFPAAADSAA